MTRFTLALAALVLAAVGTASAQTGIESVHTIPTQKAKAADVFDESTAANQFGGFGGFGDSERERNPFFTRDTEKEAELLGLKLVSVADRANGDRIRLVARIDGKLVGGFDVEKFSTSQAGRIVLLEGKVKYKRSLEIAVVEKNNGEGTNFGLDKVLGVVSVGVNDEGKVIKPAGDSYKLALKID